MLHANLRLAGIHQQTDKRVTLGCVTCGRATRHQVAKVGTKKAVICGECARVTVREWKE